MEETFLFCFIKLIKRLFTSLLFIAHWWTFEFFLILMCHCCCAKGFHKNYWMSKSGQGGMELINSWRIRVIKTIFPATQSSLLSSGVIQISFSCLLKLQQRKPIDLNVRLRLFVRRDIYFSLSQLTVKTIDRATSMYIFQPRLHSVKRTSRRYMLHSHRVGFDYNFYGRVFNWSHLKLTLEIKFPPQSTSTVIRGLNMFWFLHLRIFN